MDRESIRARLRAERERPRHPADPAPRYDDVYFEGVARLDAMEKGEHMPDISELAGTWPGDVDDGFEEAIDEHRHGPERILAALVEVRKENDRLRAEAEEADERELKLTARCGQLELDRKIALDEVADKLRENAALRDALPDPDELSACEQSTEALLPGVSDSLHDMAEDIRSVLARFPHTPKPFKVQGENHYQDHPIRSMPLPTGLGHARDVFDPGFEKKGETP